MQNSFLALLSLLVLSTAQPVQAQSIKWRKSFPASLSEAKKSGKLVMIDFYTEWCGWCKKLDQDTFPDKKIIQLSEGFVPIKLDAEKEGKDPARKYAVRGFPTVLFVNGDGKQVSRVSGYMPPETFAGEMRKALDVHNELPKLRNAFQKNPNDLQAAAKLATLLAASGDGEGAEKALRAAMAQDPANKQGHLTKAYNAVGDYFQLNMNYDKAVPFFSKAADTGKTPKDVSYALVSIAACHLSAGKLKEAIPFCEKALAIKDAPEDMRTAAKQMLDFANRKQ